MALSMGNDQSSRTNDHYPVPPVVVQVGPPFPFALPPAFAAPVPAPRTPTRVASGPFHLAEGLSPADCAGGRGAGPVGRCLVGRQCSRAEGSGDRRLSRGEGATTLLLCAARRLAERGIKPVLVDADLGSAPACQAPGRAAAVRLGRNRRARKSARSLRRSSRRPANNLALLPAREPSDESGRPAGDPSRSGPPASKSCGTSTTWCWWTWDRWKRRGCPTAACGPSRRRA